jgi:hypothetical protein
MSHQHRNSSRAHLAAATPMITTDHLPRKLVAALRAHAPMPRVAGHEALYASALLSISLSKAHKVRFLDQGPRFSQYQADVLAEVFDTERRELGQLPAQEGALIARLQAHALWEGMELARQRLGFGPALRNAWLRRTVRQAARRSGLTAWLCTLWPSPSDWTAQGTLLRRIYREALPQDHSAWQARDDDAALNHAAQVRRPALQ